MSDEPTQEGDEIHELFASLREHVVEVATDFVDRVSERIEELEKDERFTEPSVARMFLSSALQILNIVGEQLEPEKRDDDESE